MKLSEAMMLGATTNHLNSSCWDSCLLGVSVRALGAMSNRYNHEAERRWPWINNTVPWPEFDPLYSGRSDFSFKIVISRLSCGLEKGKFSLEQVVDWVRSVEPPETPSAGENEAEAGLTTPEAEKGLISAR